MHWLMLRVLAFIIVCRFYPGILLVRSWSLLTQLCTASGMMDMQAKHLAAWATYVPNDCTLLTLPLLSQEDSNFSAASCAFI
jgi:hypothetical protein